MNEEISDDLGEAVHAMVHAAIWKARPNRSVVSEPTLLRVNRAMVALTEEVATTDGIANAHVDLERLRRSRG